MQHKSWGSSSTSSRDKGKQENNVSMANSHLMGRLAEKRLPDIQKCSEKKLNLAND